MDMMRGQKVKIADVTSGALQFAVKFIFCFAFDVVNENRCNL